MEAEQEDYIALQKDKSMVGEHAQELLWGNSYLSFGLLLKKKNVLQSRSCFALERTSWIPSKL